MNDLRGAALVERLGAETVQKAGVLVGVPRPPRLKARALIRAVVHTELMAVIRINRMHVEVVCQRSSGAVLHGRAFAHTSARA